MTAIFPVSPIGTVGQPPQKTKTQIIINDESDFPDPPVAGEHILRDNHNYKIAQGVVLTNTLVPGIATQISGDGYFSEDPVVSLVSGVPAIRSLNVAFEMQDIAFAAPNCSEFMNCTGSALNSADFLQVRILGVPKLGTFNGMGMIQRNVICFLFSDGWSFTGTNIIGHLVDGSVMQSDGTAGCIYWDWDDATFNNMEMLSVKMYYGAATDVFFNSSVSGVNLIASTDAFVRGSGFGLDVFGGPGQGIPLQGYPNQFQEVGWEFKDNIPVNQTQETREVSQGILDARSSPAIVTINTAGVFEEMGLPSSGSWVDEGLQSRISTDANGVSTYFGNKLILLRIRYLVTMTKVGGGSDQLEARVAVNWVFDNTPDAGGNKSGSLTRNNNETQVTVEAEIELQPNDNFRCIYANNTGTSNIEVYSVLREVARI